MIYSGTYTVIKADVPEFFRRLKIVIIYKKYKHSLYVADPAFGIKVISTRDFLLNFTYMTIIPKFNK